MIAAEKIQFKILLDLFTHDPEIIVVNLDPNWLTQTVLDIAKVICNEQSYQDMPILADALEDAGCTETMLLTHLRKNDKHYKGNWVINAILGKN